MVMEKNLGFYGNTDVVALGQRGMKGPRWSRGKISSGLVVANSSVRVGTSSHSFSHSATRP